MFATTETVKKLAKELHAGHKMKNGKNYYGHLIRVAEKAQELYAKSLSKAVWSNKAIVRKEQIIQAAYLHDVLEDRFETPLSLVYSYNIDPEVFDAVVLLTKDKETPYEEYLEKIKSNEIARFVKMADLEHNSKLSRLT